MAFCSYCYIVYEQESRRETETEGKLYLRADCSFFVVWMNERTYARTNERTHERKNERADKRKNKRTSERTEEQTFEQNYEGMKTTERTNE